MATSKTGSGSGAQSSVEGGSATTKDAAGKSAPKGAGAKDAIKAATKAATKAAGKAAGTVKRAATGASAPDLRSEARGFVSGRPNGWSHDDWIGFLEELRGRGHNVDDKEAIGSTLERERLAHVLEKVPGIGTQRVRAITDRYGNIWRLKEASADDLARDANIPRPLAERIVESVR